METNILKYFYEFPVMKLGDISLRKLLISDAKEYYELFNSEECKKYHSDDDIPDSIESAKSEIVRHNISLEQRNAILWAISNNLDQKLIGLIGLKELDFYNKKGEVGYGLFPKYFRRKIMTRALMNILMFGFHKLSLNRVEAKILPNNTASMGLLTKIGFQEEGILREYRVIRENPTNITLFSIIKSIFLEKSATFDSNMIYHV